MRLLTSLFALLALAASATAQITTQQLFPFTGFSFTLVGNYDSSALMTQVYPSGTPFLVPRFSAYGQKSLRYATEVTSDRPVNVRFSITTQTLPGAGLSQAQNTITYRNCATNLSPPTTANGQSYCSFASSTVITDNLGTNLVNFAGSSSNPGTALFGSQFIEFQTKAIVNYQIATISYIVFVGVYTGTGSNMITLDTDFLGQQAFIYTQTQSQYTVPYTFQASSSSSTVAVPFYFATQTSVTTVFVQECPGKTCDQCDINAVPTTARRVIAGDTPSGFTNIDQSQLDFSTVVGGGGSGTSAGNLGTPSAGAIYPKHGRYSFPAIIGSSGNCVRFINRVAAGASGTNEYTITLSLNVFNCGAYTTCSACVAQTACGWCLDDNFVVKTGSQYCRVADSASRTFAVSSIAGSGTTTTCLASATLSLPRFVTDATKCQVIIKGDPRISGLQGQDFQVHGTPNEYFNLVSTPTLQVNSRFVYLDEAQCDNFTSCFTHPGTYIDEIGVMMGEQKIRVVAGAIKEASRVFINGKEVQVSSHKHSAAQMTVTFANARRVVIKTPEYMMTISQSDKFFNVESALLKTELLDQGSKLVKLAASRSAEANTFMHGLIGQTWRNNVYAGEREYEGEVSDYQVADGIWGKDFAFNLYQN